MKTHHKEELSLLICQQWELVACLEDPNLATKHRQNLHLKLAKNVYQIAHIVDVYQNPLLSFSYRGKIYQRYSDVIKDPHFELLQSELLLKEVFALLHTTTAHVIEVGELNKPDSAFVHAGLVDFRKNG
ncbi:MAG: hypothetical protein K0R51_330 [Cytophagaceae bacterium]|jgi:hypothetical protein|nr:hypothetical protein [Cytophagaceae bacterium]